MHKCYLFRCLIISSYDSLPLLEVASCFSSVTPAVFQTISACYRPIGLKEQNTQAGRNNLIYKNAVRGKKQCIMCRGIERKKESDRVVALKIRERVGKKL